MIHLAVARSNQDKEKLREACAELKVPYSEFTLIPFFDELERFRDNTIYYGSMSLLKHKKTVKSNRPQPPSPKGILLFRESIPYEHVPARVRQVDAEFSFLVHENGRGFRLRERTARSMVRQA